MARDPDFAPALYERAVLTARRYGALLSRALVGRQAISPDAPPVVPAGSESVRAELDRRDPKLATLGAEVLRDGARLERLSLEPVEAEALRGILAHHRGDHPRAIAVLQEVVRRAPDLEHASWTLARSLEAMNRLDQAEKAYGAAIARDRGYLPHRLGRCEVRTRLGLAAQAVEDAEVVLAVEPTSVEALACRGRALMEPGTIGSMKGEDPLAAWSAAERDYDRALALDPDALPALWGRGTLRRYRAAYRLRRSEDPAADLAGAEADLSRGLQRDPTAAQLLTSRGRARATRALWRARRGEDPARDLDAAIADYDLSIRLAPALLAPYEWRADAHVMRASAGGGVPWPALAAAEADLARVAAAGVATPWFFIHRGQVRAVRAQVRQAAGDNPRPDWAAAEPTSRPPSPGTPASPRHGSGARGCAVPAAIWSPRRGISSARGRSIRAPRRSGGTASPFKRTSEPWYVATA